MIRGLEFALGTYLLTMLEIVRLEHIFKLVKRTFYLPPPSKRLGASADELLDEEERALFSKDFRRSSGDMARKLLRGVVAPSYLRNAPRLASDVRSFERCDSPK